MRLETGVYKIVEQINELHLEDPKIYDYWDDLTKILSVDEELTIQFLDGLDGVDEIL